MGGFIQKYGPIWYLTEKNKNSEVKNSKYFSKLSIKTKYNNYSEIYLLLVFDEINYVILLYFKISNCILELFTKRL